MDMEVEDSSSHSAAEEQAGHQARLYKLSQGIDQPGTWEGYGEIWHVELMQPEQLSQNKQVPTLRLLSKSSFLQLEIILEVDKQMLAPNHGDTYINFVHEGSKASLSLADARLSDHLREVLGCGGGADVTLDTGPTNTTAEDNSCASQARRLCYDHSDAPSICLESLSAVVDYANQLMCEREQDSVHGVCSDGQESEWKGRRQGQGKAAQVHPMTSLAVWLSGYSAVPPGSKTDTATTPAADPRGAPLPLPPAAPCVAAMEVLQEAMDLGDEEVRGNARFLAEFILQAMAGDYSADLQEYCLLDHVFPTLYNAYLPEERENTEGEGAAARMVHAQEGLTRRVLGRTVAEKIPPAVLSSMEQVARASALISLPSGAGGGEWHAHLTSRLEFLLPELVDKLLACEQLWKDGDAFFARFYNNYVTTLPASDAESLGGWLSLYSLLMDKAKTLAARPGCLALVGQSQLFAAVDAALRVQQITVDGEHSLQAAAPSGAVPQPSSLHTLALRTLSTLLSMEGGAGLVRKAECRQNHTIVFLDSKDRDSRAADGSCMPLAAKLSSLLSPPLHHGTLLGPCLMYSLLRLAYTARERGVAEGAQECIRALSNVAADHTGAENAGILPSGSSPLLRVAENRAFLELYCAEHMPWLLLPWGDGVLPPLQSVPAAQALSVLQAELPPGSPHRLSYSRRMAICARLCPGITACHAHVTQAHAFSLAQLELLQAICQPVQLRPIYQHKGAVPLLMKGLVSRNKLVASAACRWFRQWLVGEEADSLGVLDLCNMHNVHTALVVALLVHAGQDSLLRVQLCDLLLALSPSCPHDRWGPLKVLTESNNKVMPSVKILTRYGHFVSECARIRVHGLGSCRGSTAGGLPLVAAPQLAKDRDREGEAGLRSGRAGTVQSTPTPMETAGMQPQGQSLSSGFASRDSPAVSSHASTAARKGLLGMGGEGEGMTVLKTMGRQGKAGPYKGTRTVSPTADGAPQSGSESSLPPPPGLSPDRSHAAEGMLAGEAQEGDIQSEPSARSPQRDAQSLSRHLSPAVPSPVQPLEPAEGEGEAGRGMEAAGGTWLQDEFFFAE